jgi:hypothetical protein
VIFGPTRIGFKLGCRFLTGCVFAIVFAAFAIVFSVATNSILTASEATSATDGGILEGPDGIVLVELAPDEKGVGAGGVVTAGLNTNPALLKISALTERVINQATYNGFLTCCQCEH